jgi:hypothetical protein
VLAVLVVLATGGGCVVRANTPWLAYVSPEPVVVAEPPPPARLEVRSPAPTTDGVWIEGHWEWRDGRYLWVEGRWERSRHGYAWVAPRYVRHGARWTYVRGHWRPAGAAVASDQPSVQRAIPAPPAQPGQKSLLR